MSGAAFFVSRSSVLAVVAGWDVAVRAGGGLQRDGQPVFKKGNRYISPDVDEHKGRAWKLYDNKGHRIGT